MAKKPFLAEVLTMGNSFVKATNSEFTSIKPLNSLNNLSWNLFYYFAILFDKLRFLTVSTLIFTLILYCFILAINYKNGLISFLKENFEIILLLLNSCLLAIIATIAYVANNGRYILPTILITWLFILRFKLKTH